MSVKNTPLPGLIDTPSNPPQDMTVQEDSTVNMPNSDRPRPTSNR